MIDTRKLTVGQAVKMYLECQQAYINAKARGWGDSRIMWTIMAIVQEYEDRDPISL